MSRRRTPEPRYNRKGYKARDMGYSRTLDCWNCGLPHHKSENCTAEKVLRCSFCRKRGVRSDECNCSQSRVADRRRVMTGGYHQKKRQGENSYEACLMISIYGKKVRAIVHSGEQESRIGKKVLSWIADNTQLRQTKRVIKNIVGLELVNAIVVEMGVNRQEKVPIECIIDNRLPVNEMTLGMRALVKFGYRFQVAGKETTQRKLVRKPIKADFGRKVTHDEVELSDDEPLYSHDEEKEERKRDWKY